MNILLREVKANLRSMLIWALVIGLFVFWIMSIYPSMAADADMMEQLLDMFPESMVKMFNLDTLNMGDPLGFYGVEAYFIVLLFGSIYAALLGSGILAKEEDDKTVEFLLARPVTRDQVIGNKLLAWLVYLVAFNLIIASLAGLAFVVFDMGDYSRSTLFSLLAAPLFVHIAFAALGFLSALVFTRRRAALSVSIGLVLGLYFVNAVALLTENMDFLAWFTPFRYMAAADIVTRGSISPVHMLVLLGVSALAVAITWLSYRRRDISV